MPRIQRRKAAFAAKRFQPYAKKGRHTERKEFLRRLQKLPTDFKPAIEQAKITASVSRLIAEGLHRAGIAIDANLVEKAHLARPMFRHLGGGSAEHFKAGLAMPRHTKVTKEVLERVFKNPNLGEMVGKYYSLGKEGVLKGIKAEDAAFLIGGYMTWGVKNPKSGKWAYSIWLPSEIYRKNIAIASRLQGNQKAERKDFLEKEYKNGVVPLVQWLGLMGIDLSAIKGQINGKIKAGKIR